MKKMVKLQNILLWNDIDANLRLDRDLTFRGNGLIYDPSEGCHILEKYKSVWFDTYFGSLQIQRWKECTVAKKIFLCLEVKGKCTVEVQELFRNSKTENISILIDNCYDCEEKKWIYIDITDATKPIVSFTLSALEDLFIYNACYMAEVEEKEIRDVLISLVSTTFKKEEYVKNNIQSLKKTILSDSEVKDHFYVNIIDNGRTLDPDKLDSERLKIYPNKNVGGAGGFTRGMIESLNLPNKPTHVLLMDDDVLVLSESLYRTYYLLRLLKPEYCEHFISGAMFDYDSRNIQYEDVGYVHRASAGYGPVKDRLDMRSVPSLLNNEEMAEKKQDYSYAGWWYCCIPVSAIEKNGLPLPVFVRGDDVEFSIRNKAEFLTLNGICIWHVGFGGKFNAAMELYQVHRNSLIIQATSGIFPDIDFVGRIKPLFWKELTRFAYDNAEQLLDSIDDFMKGPDYIKSLDGEKSLKEHNAKNEKMLPFSEFPEKLDIWSQNPYQHTPIKPVEKIIYYCTINGHLLPNFMLKKKPQFISYDWFFSARTNYMRRNLVAINANERTAHWRSIDRKRCFALIKHYIQTMNNYNKNHENVENAYKKEFKVFSSPVFWEKYLTLDNN